MGEDRPAPRDEFLGLGIEDERPDQVGGQEVGGELDPREARVEPAGERPDGERLGEARDPLEEDVAVGQEADDEPFDHLRLADDDLPHLGEEGGDGEGAFPDSLGEGGRVGGGNAHRSSGRVKGTRRRTFHGRRAAVSARQRRHPTCESNADAATIRRGSAILARPMRRPLLPLAAAALLLLALLLPRPGRREDDEEEEVPKPRPDAHARRPYYGPPAPTPEPYLRAAGACMEFTPGQYLVLAEVGATGRVFRIDADTRIEADVRKGARVRVLYVDGPEGPVARKILPGPAAATPPPRTP